MEINNEKVLKWWDGLTTNEAIKVSQRILKKCSITKRKESKVK